MTEQNPTPSSTADRSRPRQAATGFVNTKQGQESATLTEVSQQFFQLLDQPVQLLDASGTRLPHPHYDSYLGAFEEQLIDRYRDMVMVRRFDKESTALQRQGELALFVPAQGQEAAQIGSAAALAPQDYVFPSYREHGVLHCRGIDPATTLRLFRGIDQGGWDPHEYKVHLYTLVIGSHALHATGYAQGIMRDGCVGTGDSQRDEAVICYFGDGATSQGDVNEALVFAAASNAPIVFFCQNNQWAISAPASVQSRVPFVRRGLGVGISTIRVDGNDLLACYAVTREALERARCGGGPTFIEAVTYRMGAHTTSDDPSRYRSRSEEELWQSRDPIDRLAAYLGKRLTAQIRTEIDTQADAYAAHVRNYCHSLLPPAPQEMLDHVYASPHAGVQADADWLAEWHRS